MPQSEVEQLAFPLQTGRAARLPPSLARHRLLDHVRLGSPRFVPTGEPEVLKSIFATWNLLDAFMYQHDANRYQTGYLREIQVRRMVQLVRAPHVKTYCEVGMNGGHSVSAMLLANQNVTAHVFDLFKWKYSTPVVSLLNMTFSPERFDVHAGYSWNTLPDFVKRFRREGRTCDLILVDGGHSARAARSDITMLAPLANARTKLIVDDIGVNPGPGSVLKKLNETGKLVIEELYGPYEKDTMHNPCMRRARDDDTRAPKLSDANLRLVLCHHWGFAVSRFANLGQHWGGAGRGHGGHKHKGGGIAARLEREDTA